MSEDTIITNQDIIQASKDQNGILYHRLNSLQVQVNRLREEKDRLHKKVSEYEHCTKSFTDKEAVERVINLLLSNTK